jgi:hypothetical protein
VPPPVAFALESPAADTGVDGASDAFTPAGWGLSVGEL